jgi:hypothetical protein
MDKQLSSGLTLGSNYHHSISKRACKESFNTCNIKHTYRSNTSGKHIPLILIGESGNLIPWIWTYHRLVI